MKMAHDDESATPWYYKWQLWVPTTATLLVIILVALVVYLVYRRHVPSQEGSKPVLRMKRDKLPTNPSAAPPPKMRAFGRN
jgi:hypothetical protein